MCDEETTSTVDALDSSNSKSVVGLNLSDINEFRLLECTNEILLNSPDSSKKQPMILSKEKALLLSSTSSYFQDSQNSENEFNLKRPSFLETTEICESNPYAASVSKKVVQMKSDNEDKPNNICDMVNNQASNESLSVMTCEETSTEVLSFMGDSEVAVVDKEAENEIFSTAEAEAANSDMEVGEEEEEEEEEDGDDVSTILPQLMQRSLKEVNYPMENNGHEKSVSKITIEKRTTSIEKAKGNVVESFNSNKSAIDPVNDDSEPIPSDNTPPIISNDLKPSDNNPPIISNDLEPSNHPVPADTQLEPKQTDAISIDASSTDDGDLVQAEMDVSNQREMEVEDSPEAPVRYEKVKLTRVYHQEMTYYVKIFKSKMAVRSCQLTGDMKLMETKAEKSEVDVEELGAGIEENVRGLDELDGGFENDWSEFRNELLDGSKAQVSPTKSLAKVSPKLKLVTKPSKLSPTKPLVTSNPVLLSNTRQASQSEEEVTKPKPRQRSTRRSAASKAKTSKIEPPISTESCSNSETLVTESKKRQIATTEEDTDVRSEKVSPGKKRYKQAVKKTGGFKFASLKIDLSPRKDEQREEEMPDMLVQNEEEVSTSPGTEKELEEDMETKQVLLVEEVEVEVEVEVNLPKKRVSKHQSDKRKTTKFDNHATVIPKKQPQKELPKCLVFVDRLNQLDSLALEYKQECQSSRRSRYTIYLDSEGHIIPKYSPSPKPLPTFTTSTTSTKPRQQKEQIPFKTPTTPSGRSRSRSSRHQEPPITTPTATNPEFSNQDLVFTLLTDRDQTYYPAVVTKIKNDIESGFKTYQCKFLDRPDDGDEQPEIIENLEASEAVKFDKLVRGDRVRVWAETKQRYVNAEFVKMSVGNAEGGSKEKSVEFKVKIESNSKLRTVDVSHICLLEDTFLQIFTRENTTPAKSEEHTPVVLNTFSETIEWSSPLDTQTSPELNEICID